MQTNFALSRHHYCGRDLHNAYRKQRPYITFLSFVLILIVGNFHMLQTWLRLSVADPDFPFRGGGGHEMRLNAKGTVGSFGGRKLIYNKILWGAGPLPPPPPIRLWL